ncbi:hypothetical protein EDC01DRAFT_370202 [Geopyxis carbonaria]|nr:hypothetical protein EDC01DRAFT_370202 [Geopyxis carbonaria]
MAVAHSAGSGAEDMLSLTFLLLSPVLSPWQQHLEQKLHLPSPSTIHPQFSPTATDAIHTLCVTLYLPPGCICVGAQPIPPRNWLQWVNVLPCIRRRTAEGPFFLLCANPMMQRARTRRTFFLSFFLCVHESNTAAATGRRGLRIGWLDWLDWLVTVRLETTAGCMFGPEIAGEIMGFRRERDMARLRDVGFVFSRYRHSAGRM